MSETNQVQNDLKEKEEKIVVSPEDCNAALDFWKHFNIPVPQDLQDAIDSFAKDQTFENQQKVKLAVCQAINTSTHEAFQDEMFAKISEECGAISYDMLFDRNLEETLSVDTSTQKDK